MVGQMTGSSWRWLAVSLPIVLVVALDLILNDANWLKAFVAYTNAVMWKIGPI
jgi:hypothetical protein